MSTKPEYTEPQQYPHCGLNPDTISCLTENMHIVDNDKLRRYANAIQDSLYLDDTNIADKAKCVTSIVHIWITVHARETKILAQLEKRLVQRKQEWIAVNGIEEKMVYRQNEIIRNSCPDIIKIENVIEIQKEVVQYLTESLKAIRDFRWDVTNALNALKLENT